MLALRQSFVFRLSLLCALGVSACLALAAAASPETERVITAVEHHYNAARTLSVQFTEELEAGRRSRPAESGRLVLEKQGKMRWDYTQPAGKLFLSDGKSVYLYTPGDNRVEKIPLRNTEDMRAPLAFLLGRLDLHKEFRDFQVRPAAGANWLSAAAKNDRVPYERVDLLISDDGSIRQLRVGGRDGSLLAFTFSGEQVNPPLNPALFRFTVPPGAQVVDAVELQDEGK